MTENDACGVDGIQAVLGCTFGKGQLLYRLTGKQAYSFFDRKSGQKLRLVQKPFHKEMDRAARIRVHLEAPRKSSSPRRTGLCLPEPARLFQS